MRSMYGVTRYRWHAEENDIQTEGSGYEQVFVVLVTKAAAIAHFNSTSADMEQARQRGGMDIFDDPE